jgi:hypothetical protein
MESSITMNSFETIDGAYDPTLSNTNVEWLQDNMNPVNYEPRKTKKTSSKKGKALDEFETPDEDKIEE